MRFYASHQAGVRGKSRRNSGFSFCYTFPVKAKFLIGIDEAGRGPLAGPVAVGVFAVRSKSVLKRFKGARDSKKLTEAQREAFFLQIKEAHKDGHVYYSVSYSSSNFIDEKGIVPAVKSAMNRALKRLERDFLQGPTLDNCKILLDGALAAPARYLDQTTIIGGDDLEPVISLASICAKVLRDRKMKRLAKKHSQYGFEIHKGYGTKSHYRAIRKHGLSEIHRKSFVKAR
jgi:ribonuclease HII